MKKESIIDENFYTGWKNYVFHEDEIRWIGKPQIEQSYRFLEKDFYHDVMTGVSSTITIYAIFLISIIYAMYELGFHFIAIIITFLGITVPFLVEYLRYKNQLRTEYAITDKYVLFKIFNVLSFKIHAIPIEDIFKIHLTHEIKNIGTIILVTSKSVNFTTYNGRTGQKRDHPTLEFISDCDQISQLLKKLIANNPKKNFVYKEPTITGIKLKTTKILFAVFISFMSVYLADFFLLPSNTIIDKGNLMNRNLVESDYSRHPEDMGGHYQTKQGISFNTSGYYPELGISELELQISPIFKIVTGVKNNRMDFTDRLSSSLNHLITKCAYFFAYFVIVSGFFIIRNKTIVNAELLGKVVMSAIGFLFVLYLAWRIHN